MVSLESLALKGDYRFIEALSRIAYENPSKIFKAYSGTYYYTNFGVAEFSVAEVENENGIKGLCGFSTHLMGDHIYRMKVTSLLSEQDMKCCALCSPLRGESLALPVSFVLSDCLPSILPGDTIVFQGVAFLDSGRFYLSEAEADGDEEVLKQRKLIGVEPGFSPKLVFFKGDGSSPTDGVVPVYTKVHGLKRYHAALQIEGYASSICTVEASSSFGEITVAVPEAFLREDITDRLENNEEVLMYGYLHFSGDVGVREYQKGTVYDEAHLLRVVRHALETCNLERLERNLSPDCEYYGTNGRRLTGRKEIISQMRRVLDAQHESEKDIQHQAVATVSEVTDSGKAEYGIGKQCLLSYSVNSHGGYQCVIFIEVEENQISALKFTYESCYKFKIDADTVLAPGRPVFTDISHRKD